MQQELIVLLAWKNGANTFQSPDQSNKIEVIIVPAGNIVEVIQSKFGSKIKERKSGSENVIEVFETPLQVKANENPSTDNFHCLKELALSLTANGSSQAEANTLTKYFNVVKTASESGVGVKCTSMKANQAKKLVNAASEMIKVYPAEGEKFEGLEANVPIELEPDQGIYIYALIDGVLKTIAF